ncbi:MAG: hypothetical protein ACXACT_18475, partial [Candidatus Thorarchaeota archaeon]|jgi:hypothetical protein
MKYNIIQITNEHSLNKVISQHKKDKQRLDVLFVSNWCSRSRHILNLLLKNHASSEEEGHPVYIVDSWNTPHAFQIWNATEAPTLVRVDPFGRGDKGQSVKKSSYVSEILHMLRLENLRPKTKSKKA